MSGSWREVLDSLNRAEPYRVGFSIHHVYEVSQGGKKTKDIETEAVLSGEVDCRTALPLAVRKGSRRRIHQGHGDRACRGSSRLAR